MSDLELLRRYEPVIRYTRGELFFPIAVDGFVRACSLWAREDGRSRLVVPRGKLDLDRLARHGETAAGRSLYLRFVEEPLPPLEYQRWLHRPGRVRLEVPGRLARVPLLSRLLDAAFDLSLLLRGRVPGGTAAAAELRCRELAAADPRRVYYGRVVREGGWIVLHYLFFYPMNNWRSGFFGTNDHESDWEQVFVYLAPGEDGAVAPHWVAYAAHDFAGDDLRRRWDDPHLTREGNHPVVYAGAGSHASYFEPGEYVMQVEPRVLAPIKRAIVRFRALWAERLGQGGVERIERKAAALVSIPFVDYARGDGASIGPGGGAPWSPMLIADDIPWVDRYRGLWGLDTRDPFGGERAPSGPKYNRDGSVRQSWYDPVGWAGLAKVVPPPELPAAVAHRLDELDAEAAELETRIAQARRTARRLALDHEALRATAYPTGLHRRKTKELDLADRELRTLQARRNDVLETRQAIVQYRERVRSGRHGDPRAHLRRAHRPEPSAPARRRLLEFWAAISGAAALLAFVGLVVIAPPFWWLWTIVVALGFGTVEAAAHGRLSDFLLSVVVILAVVTGMVLLWEFWRVVVLVALVALVAFMVRENLRELRSG